MAGATSKRQGGTLRYSHLLAVDGDVAVALRAAVIGRHSKFDAGAALSRRWRQRDPQARRSSRSTRIQGSSSPPGFPILRLRRSSAVRRATPRHFTGSGPALMVDDVSQPVTSTATADRQTMSAKLRYDTSFGQARPCVDAAPLEREPRCVEVGLGSHQGVWRRAIAIFQPARLARAYFSRRRAGHRDWCISGPTSSFALRVHHNRHGIRLYQETFAVIPHADLRSQVPRVRRRARPDATGVHGPDTRRSSLS